MEEVTQSANQSAETTAQDTLTSTPEQQGANGTTSQETAQPEGIRVKYNKEDRLIGLDEAPTWIQKGLNYDKLQERTTQYEQQAKHLERVAKFYGYETVDDYIKDLDQAEQDRLVQQDADRYGVPEEFIRSELQPIRGELDALKAERDQLRQERMQIQVNQELAAARAKYPDFDNYNEQVFEMVTQRGYGIEEAYRLASYDDKLNNATKQAEAETIRKLQQNAASSPGALGQGDVEHKTGFASLSKADQRKFIADVKAGRRTDF